MARIPAVWCERFARSTASALVASVAGRSATRRAAVNATKRTRSTYDGTTLLKTVALSGSAAEFTTSKLTHGTHTITATYNGSTNFDGSSASLTQTVN